MYRTGVYTEECRIVSVKERLFRAVGFDSLAFIKRRVEEADALPEDDDSEGNRKS